MRVLRETRRNQRIAPCLIRRLMLEIGEKVQSDLHVMLNVGSLTVEAAHRFADILRLAIFTSGASLHLPQPKAVQVVPGIVPGVQHSRRIPAIINNAIHLITHKIHDYSSFFSAVC